MFIVAMLVLIIILFVLLGIGGASWTSPALTLPATPRLPQPHSHGFVKTDDNSSIWYARFGHKKFRKQKTVTFLHGGLANSDYWGEQILHLVSRGYACLAIDSRGHGRSAAASNSSITDHKMTKDVLHVLHQLQIEQTTVVGWSDGAIIGLDMAMHHAASLQGLFAFGATYSPANTNISVTSNPIFTKYLSRAEREFRTLNPHPAHLPLLENEVREMWSTLPTWTERSFQAIKPRSDGGPLVWIVDGAEEEAVNRSVPLQLSSWIPDSGLLILPMVSHFAFLQDPQTFNMMLDRFMQYLSDL